MNIVKIIKLDILSVKPYLTIKNLVLLLFFSFFYAVLFKNPTMSIVMSSFFSILFAAYPFMVGEEAGIDPLFKIMGIKSDEVVKGRYLVSIFFVTIVVIIGTIFGIFVGIFYPMENGVVLLTGTALAVFLFTSVVIFMQYPLYFKLGYMKAKMVTGIPFFIIGILIFLSSKYSIKFRSLIQFFIEHGYLMLFGFFLIWCLIFFVSLTFSQKYYRKRDF